MALPQSQISLTFWALCIDPPFAKLIRGSWLAKVVVMSERSTEQIRELLDSLYRVDSGRILATLIRLLGDFDLAEEAMHEAFAAALSLWPRSGVLALIQQEPERQFLQERIRQLK